MNGTLQIVCFYSVAALLLSIVGAHANGQKPAPRVRMPEELNGVELTMKFPEVQGRRHGRLVRDSDLPAGQYVELGIPSPFFDRAFYFFRDGLLTKIVARKTAEGPDFIEAHRTHFIQTAIRMWGEDFQRLIRVHQGTRDLKHYLPALVWVKPGVTTAIIYTPSVDVAGRRFDTSIDPIARFFLFYFETVIMASEEIPLDLIRPEDVRGGDRIFSDMKQVKI